MLVIVWGVGFAELLAVLAMWWLAVRAVLLRRSSPDGARARLLATRALLLWLAVGLLAILATIAGVVHSFQVVSGNDVDPSQKARILAAGISEAMSCAAFGGVTTLVPGIVALVVLLRARGAAARA